MPANGHDIGHATGMSHACKKASVVFFYIKKQKIKTCSPPATVNMCKPVSTSPELITLEMLIVHTMVAMMVLDVDTVVISNIINDNDNI